MKVILKPTQEVINVSYDKENNLYYNIDKPYIKYFSNDIEVLNEETRLKNKMINDIFSTFDFSKVRKCMELLGWKYWDVEDTPTIDKLKDTARELLNEVYGAKDYMTVSTGGFRAEYFPELEHGTLKLSFIVEEYEVTKKHI